MTDTVYSVKGGMEDWVYGVGWENQVFYKLFIKFQHYRSINQSENQPVNFDCMQNQTLSPKLSESDFSGVKTSIILIETSDSKQPQESEFGIRSDEDKCVIRMFESAFQEVLTSDQK